MSISFENVIFVFVGLILLVWALCLITMISKTAIRNKRSQIGHGKNNLNSYVNVPTAKTSLREKRSSSSHGESVVGSDLNHAYIHIPEHSKPDDDILAGDNSFQGGGGSFGGGGSSGSWGDSDSGSGGDSGGGGGD
jgi:uncharacterized membrane protein YgcG